MISYAQAVAAIEALPLRGSTSPMRLSAALGAVLAEPIALAQDQPPFDRATMDGFAVMLQAGTATYRIIGTVSAGEAWGGELRAGEAVRIMTGAPCPAGTTVVPSEMAREAGDLVACDAAALVADRNIARRGEDGAAGAVIVPACTRMTPLTLAVAAMCGAEQVQVHCPPRLALVTTGDEVGGAGPGGIRDSNGPFLESFAAAMGCMIVREHARDEMAAVRSCLARARLAADVIITTGGVSSSAADLVPAAAAAEGFRVVFHQVAMQPGKPVLLAQHDDGRLLVGLPGNAVSVVTTAHLILLPVLGRLLGGCQGRWVEAPLALARTVAPKRQQFLPARLTARGVEPIAWNGSGDLIAAAAGSGLVDCPAGACVAAGAAVRYLPYVGSSAGGVSLVPPRGRER